MKNSSLAKKAKFVNPLLVRQRLEHEKKKLTEGTGYEELNLAHETKANGIMVFVKQEPVIVVSKMNASMAQKTNNKKESPYRMK